MARTPRKWYPLSLSEAVIIPDATVTRTAGRPAIYLPITLSGRFPTGTKVVVFILKKELMEEDQ